MLSPLMKEIRHNPLLWLLVFVPVVFAGEKLAPDAHTLLFVLSVLAIVPLAALLSHATESVAAKTGDAVGGLLNATLGNLTELVIALAALRAGQYTLVKATIAGAIVTNTLFTLGMCFLLGGLKHRLQEYSRVGARFQAALLFLATIALLVPSAVAQADRAPGATVTQTLSLGIAVLLIVAYGLGMLFSLKTHRDLFASAEHGEEGEAPWPLGLAFATLAGVTVLVALVSEVFVDSVQQAAEAFGMTPAFVGFIVVALVGAAAEMASAFSAARKNRLDLSVGIALGSASQIALFVAPVLVLLSYVIGPSPMAMDFWPGAVVMILIATLTATLVTNSGRSAWFVGVLVLMVYLIFAMTLYLLPPVTRVTEREGAPMSDQATKSSKSVLDPVDRVSEVLFGLIMVLTFTGSLSVANAGRDDIRAMLIGALGCNLAWGIIDGILYVMGCLAEKASNLMTVQAVRRATDPQQAHRLIADALPPVMASVLRPAELDAMQQRLMQLPEPPRQAHLSKDDWLGGAAVFLVVFLSTFPVVIPFIVMRQRRAGPPRLERHRDRDVVHHRLRVRPERRTSPLVGGDLDGGNRRRALGPHHGARRMRQARLLALLAIGPGHGDGARQHLRARLVGDAGNRLLRLASCGASRERTGA